MSGSNSLPTHRARVMKQFTFVCCRVFSPCNQLAKNYLLSLQEVQESEYRYYKDVDNNGNAAPPVMSVPTRLDLV